MSDDLKSLVLSLRADILDLRKEVMDVRAALKRSPVGPYMDADHAREDPLRDFDDVTGDVDPEPDHDRNVKADGG
ncbi:MAG: hypothetical protein HPM95_02235 [Alphaproteobacteria bacterium]|uniref:hypothetical protein n=1 Tax=Stappia sp. TaxID=1870903 RepID=UPI001EB46E61|nr:hypothetical protein [Alphaproteobacteria bacterium]